MKQFVFSASGIAMLLASGFFIEVYVKIANDGGGMLAKGMCSLLVQGLAIVAFMLFLKAFEDIAEADKG